MNYKQVISHWGGPTKVAQALGIKRRQTVQMWSVYGRIPTRWQILAQAKSGGKLKADRQAREEAMAIVACVAQAAND